MTKYQPSQFEKKWIETWDKNKIYQSSENDYKEKMYVLDMFPYPSGAGLHVGHPRGYTATDILSRYYRMNNYSVLHPMGWDAFGLPAENAAVKAKKNPIDMVPLNIANFKRQMKMLGFSYDWSREFSTTDPSYYKWTQWLFIQFFKMGLLYKKNTPINYCPKCKTGLAEEEVLANGTHERCGNKIEKKDLPQWLFRITAYADRLLKDLDGLKWPKGILEMQRNWIGRKEGIDITYQIVDNPSSSDFFRSSGFPPDKSGFPSLSCRQAGRKKTDDPSINVSKSTLGEITCFTTRPDTNFGATFIVIALEHPFVASLLNSKIKCQMSKLKKISDYVEKTKTKSQMERESEGRKKTGVFTGFYAVNNLNGRLLPIWISDFVLSGFGTGAVVGVPGHDLRDFEFAKEYDIPIIRVVVGADKDSSDIKQKEQVQEEEGTMINSDFLNGMDIHAAIIKIMDYLEEKGWGKRKVTYHLRDWIFSRQRYWGEPIPMVFCEKCAKNQSQISKVKSQIYNLKIKVSDEVIQSNAGWFPIPEDQLPLELPYVKSYEPGESGESPLAGIDTFVKTTCPNCGGPAKRETDTMPNWAGSCWYFLHFALQNANPKSKTLKPKQTSINNLQHSKQNNLEFNNSDLIRIWDLKFGVSIKKWLPVDWYFGGAEHAVLHLLYSRFWVKALQDLGLLDFPEPFLRLQNVGMVLAEDHHKMSKSLGNVINPDDVVSEYGADSLRMYEMFMAPFSQEIAWSTKTLQGVYRFLSRVWKMYQEYKTLNPKPQILKNETNKKLISKLNKTIKKVTSDILEIKFNTAIASMMEFLNAWEEAIQRHSGTTSDCPESDSGVTLFPRMTKCLSVDNAKKFLKILAPFAPFITEEIWNTVFGETESIHLSNWPEVGEIEEDKEIIIPVQVNGKMRGTIVISSSATKEEVEKKALSSEKIKQYIGGKNYTVIYVSGKILNFVVR